MKIFNKKDGGIVQLIDKEKMQEWSVELPLIFIEYIRNNLMNNYEDSNVKKDIEAYLNEILEEVAIPRLIDVLDGDNNEEIILALKRIEELSKKKIELVDPIKPYIPNLKNKDNKEIIKLCDSILENFDKVEKRKKLAEKRNMMRQKEKDFLEGKISGEEYAKARKDYLILKD
ncbi:MAG: hypothetical protein EAX89_03395 [Candidatus Lokiarchaeota archaeon]|nr:hypothetical protein [Candidatus Lokiarchaeota archaeon]